ncbi:hypothetical protein [Nonomuraea salmonea]|uniref:Uncharacterized protein n=1 Tax=Nonomuraea salmonea TaxID=46181 RepID=A0ABV5P2X2_9ACTN
MTLLIDTLTVALQPGLDLLLPVAKGLLDGAANFLGIVGGFIGDLLSVSGGGSPEEGWQSAVVEEAHRLLTIDPGDLAV